MKELAGYFYYSTILCVILLVFGMTMAWYWKPKATDSPPAQKNVENFEIRKPIQEEGQDKQSAIQKIPTEDWR